MEPPRNRHWSLKLLLSLTVCTALFLGGAFLAFISLMAGGEKFYTPLILILTVLLMGVNVAVIFDGRPRKGESAHWVGERS